MKINLNINPYFQQRILSSFTEQQQKVILVVSLIFCCLAASCYLLKGYFFRASLKMVLHPYIENKRVLSSLIEKVKLSHHDFHIDPSIEIDKASYTAFRVIAAWNLIKDYPKEKAIEIIKLAYNPFDEKEKRESTNNFIKWVNEAKAILEKSDFDTTKVDNELWHRVLSHDIMTRPSKEVSDMCKICFNLEKIFIAQDFLDTI